jgi:hypothetical protein
MQTLDETRYTVYRLGKIINAPSSLLSLPDISRGDGTPHIEILGEEYHYVSSERGIENDRKQTFNIDELLYWIFSDVTSSMSYSYELSHRVLNQDFRRLAFSKKLDLLGTLSDDWSQRESKKIEDTLRCNPYDDDTDKRVSLCKSYSDQGFSAEDSYIKACVKYPLPE